MELKVSEIEISMAPKFGTSGLRGLVSELTPEQSQLAQAEYRKAAEKAKDARARDKLRRQVRHFVEFLQKEGVVDTPK